MSYTGLLQLTLKSANDLHKHDIFGKQQPYCLIDCGRYRVKGKTCKDGGQNPTWSETMFFQVSTETEVAVTVFAEHALSKDTPIGAAVIPIVQVRQTGSEDVSVPISFKGKQAGTLHVTMEFKGPQAAYGQIGTAYGQAATGGDPAAGRRALQGSRASIFGSSSSSFSARSGTGQQQPLRLASMPIRLLQQQGSGLLQPQQQHAGAAGSHMPSQQQQQSPNQQPAYQPFPGGLPTSRSLTQQDATLEAQGLLLQRQCLQQLQQLQLLQTQLLGNHPLELQQQQQQNLLRQQQLLSQLALQRTGCVSSLQHDTLQQRSSSGSSSSDSAGALLRLPRQPKRTAADLFQPESHGMTSSAAASFGQLLRGGRGLGDEDLLLDDSDALLSDGTSVSAGFDMSRLQAILQKVYPDRNVSSIWGQKNTATDTKVDTKAHGHGPLTAATATGTADGPTMQQQCSLPNSTGAFGTTAALAAAAAAAGVDVDSQANGTAQATSAARNHQAEAQSAVTVASSAATVRSPSLEQMSIPTSTGAFGTAAALAAAAAALDIRHMPSAGTKTPPHGAAAAAAGPLGATGLPAAAAASAHSTRQGSLPSSAGVSGAAAELAATAVAASTTSESTPSGDSRTQVSGGTTSAGQQRASSLATMAGTGQPVQQFVPSSTGAFGAAAALAAAAAAGADVNAVPAQGGSTHSSKPTVVAVRQQDTPTAASGIVSQDGSIPSSTGAFGSAIALAAAAAASMAAESYSAELGARPCYGGTMALEKHTQQVQAGFDTCSSAASAQSAPPALAICSTHPELVSSSSGHTTSLTQLMSAPAITELHGGPAAEAVTLHVQQQQQQLLLSPDVTGVLAEELVQLKLAAPVLAQLLGLAPLQSPNSGAAAAAAPAAGALPGSSAAAGQQATATAAAAAAAEPVPATPSPAAGAAAATAPPTPSLRSYVASPAAAAAGAAAACGGVQTLSAGCSSSGARSAAELAWLLENAENDKANLIRQLQKRDLQVQQLRDQLSQQQQQLQKLEQRLAQRQQQQQRH